MTSKVSALVAAMLPVCLTGCGSPQEAPTVELGVYADASALEVVTTDLGYEVELDAARMVISDLQFTIAGEAHAASLWRKVSSFLISDANAHPGHYQGGEVTGELRGRYLVDWLPGKRTKLGTARLIVGTYSSANFGFESARETDEGLTPSDSLVGHGALLSGTAVKGEAHISFLALIDSPKGRRLVGAPFDETLTEGRNGRLGLRLTTKDPVENDTLFDGIDFAMLDADGDGNIVLEGAESEGAALDAYNQLRRTFQTHDHFAVVGAKE